MILCSKESGHFDALHEQIVRTTRHKLLIQTLSLMRKGADKRDSVELSHAISTLVLADYSNQNLFMARETPAPSGRSASTRID